MTVNEIGKGAHFRDKEDEPQRATDTSVPKSTSSVPKPGTPPSAPVAPKYDALSQAEESPEEETPERQAGAEASSPRGRGIVSMVSRVN